MPLLLHRRLLVFSGGKNNRNGGGAESYIKANNKGRIGSGQEFGFSSASGYQYRE